MRRRLQPPTESTIALADPTEEVDDGPSDFHEDAPPILTKNARWKDFAKIAEEFKSFRPASEALTNVRAVQTNFCQFDHATRVNGLPIERFTLLHGPSAGGKTKFTLGLLLSFLKRDHLAVLIDAERTTPQSWIRSLMGEYADHPFFFGDRPQTYEKTVLAVRSFVNTVKKLREKKKISEDTTALMVVDSIRKLVPAGIFEKITEAAKGKQNGKMKDRSAQIKAAMNAAWMDELIPLLEETKTAMVVIARETEDPDADPRSKMFGTAYKVGGGTALYYDASMDIRVERAKYVTKENEEGTRPTVYGERHRVTIKKSKVAGKEDKSTVCYFHTSNGLLIPEGFDRARDVLEMAKNFKIVEGTTWLKWGRHKWQGEHAAVKKLTASPEVLDELEAKVRSKFITVTPLEHDADGVIA